MNPASDPLDDFLSPPRPHDPTLMRQRLRRQTSRIVRWPRVLAFGWKLVMQAAAVILLVVVGYFVIEMRQQWVALRQPVVVAPKQPAPDLPPNLPAVVEVEPVSPVALEWQAFDSQERRAAAYFLAGNKYLDANQDVESALRCYAQAFDACSPQELAIAPEDNWLVVTLKIARRKEIAND